MNMIMTLAMVIATTIGAPAYTAHSGPPTGNPRVIKLTAKKFDFTPGEITVKKGEPVILELTTADRVHGFNLPDFKVTAKIEPGKVSRVEFTPDKTGEFTFSCNVFCGSGHEDMNGKLIVTD